jgi:hypothetical protein
MGTGKAVTLFLLLSAICCADGGGEVLTERFALPFRATKVFLSRDLSDAFGLAVLAIDYIPFAGQRLVIQFLGLI